MRDAGGALGPVDGVNPELHNMTCSMTMVDPGDIVFITSDGISDNFDPVVGKFCVIREDNTKQQPGVQKPKEATQNGGGENGEAAGLTSVKSPTLSGRKAEVNGAKKGLENEDEINGSKV